MKYKSLYKVEEDLSGIRTDRWIKIYYPKLSHNNLEKILKQIELIALNTEYESISATIEETILENNKINFSNSNSLNKIIEKAKVEYFKDTKPSATRKSSEMLLSIIAKFPYLIGGSADLAGSNNTKTNARVINAVTAP